MPRPIVTKTRKKLVRIFEGSFKNLHNNIQHLHQGNISSSREATPFYQEYDLPTKKNYVTGSWGVPEHLTKRRSIG